MKRVILSLLAMLVALSIPAAAFEVDVKGEVEQDIVYDDDTEKFEGLTQIDLQLSKDFGFDKMLYLNPVFKYSYNEDIKFEDLKLEKKLKEGYFDLYLDNADIRIGKQLVNWGTAYEINPTDIVNPMDLTASNPLEEELAVPAVMGKYYYDFNTEITGVMITDFVASPLTEAARMLAKAEIENNIIDGITVKLMNSVPGISEEAARVQAKSNLETLKTNGLFVINDAVEPDVDSLEDAEYALQFTRRDFYGYDVSVSYFNGYEDLPGITSDLNEVMGKLGSEPTSIDFGYKRTQALGLNVIGAVSDFGIWSETNYSFNEDDEKTIETVLGGDYTFDNNLYVVGQYYHRQYEDYAIEMDNIDALILHGQMPFRQIHEWSANVIYDINNEDYLINPEIDFSLGNGIKLNLGTMVTSDSDNSNTDSLLSLLGSEKSYVKLSYSF